jgi:hypothetical protein
MKKSKICLNRIWLGFVVVSGSLLATYFDFNPTWAVVGMLVVFALPFTFDLIVATGDAIEYDRKHRTPANTMKRLRGFVGTIPMYDEPTAPTTTPKDSEMYSETIPANEESV